MSICKMNIDQVSPRSKCKRRLERKGHQGKRLSQVKITDLVIMKENAVYHLRSC